MATLLFIGFIVYLYAPHLLFKFAAATQYDFIIRRDIPQVEEFFAGTLPSTCLNGITFVELWLFYRFALHAHFALDRVAVAAVFATKEESPKLADYISTWQAWPTVIYLLLLAFNCLWIGNSYGTTETKIALYGNPADYVLSHLNKAKQALHAGELRRGIGESYKTSLAFRRVMRMRFWRLFYAELRHPLYPMVLRKSWAFVLTKQQGLFHGRLYSYDKKRDGDTEGIYLANVSRFSREREEVCIAKGKTPISDLTGPIFLRWEEVADINFPLGPQTLESKRAEYDVRIRIHADEEQRKSSEPVTKS